MSRILVATCWARAVTSSSACPRSLSRAALRHLDRMERSAGASRRLAVAGEGHRGEPGSAENLVGILSLRGPVAATACWRSAPGSGYQTAVLSQLVKQVYTIEIIEALANAARARLESLGYSNVALRAGDGYRAHHSHVRAAGGATGACRSAQAWRETCRATRAVSIQSGPHRPR